jgi:hypothetical protein
MSNDLLDDTINALAEVFWVRADVAPEELSQ